MSIPHESIYIPRQGDRVAGKILRIVGSGIIVQLNDGRRGVIRRQELSWSRSLKGKERTYIIGEEIEAVVLGHDGKEGLIELSLKRAQGDPWDKIKQAGYRPGSVVPGEVVNLEGYGAFVEIEPGVVGLLHKSAIPRAQDKPIYDLLWVGDQVEVVIETLDEQKRRIGLSIIEYLRKRHQGFDQNTKATPRKPTRRLLWAKYGTDDSLRAKLRQRIRSILIVDDDQEFSQGFKQWLRRYEYDVQCIETGRDALLVVQDFDLVFLDVNLPDTLGTTIVDDLVGRAPNIIIVLITAQDQFTQDVSEFDGLPIADILFKPIDYAELSNVLIAAETGALFERSPRLPTERRILNTGFLDTTSVQAHHFNGFREFSNSVLDDLRLLIDAQTVLLFQVDVFTRQIAILGVSSSEVIAVQQEALQSLRFSIVMNVALDEEDIFEGKATSSKRFDTFLTFHYAESCLAVPVPVNIPDTKCALFVLDREQDKFSKDVQRLVVAFSIYVAALINENYITTQLQHTHTFALLGQLSSGLLHELRNKLNRIEQEAQLLELDCQDNLVITEPALLAARTTQMAKRATRILDSSAELRELAKRYLGLMQKEERLVVNINQILAATVRQLSPLAYMNKIHIETRFDDRLPLTRISSLKLEQVFLNIAVNAIQLMAEQSYPGQLQIASAYDIRDRDHPIKIQFIDEGPGIHCKLWDWIFQLGTSTKGSGTGLGLFISKGLLESLGGRISLEKSYMFVGSTFLVELPVVLAQEVADDGI